MRKTTGAACGVAVVALVAASLAIAAATVSAPRSARIGGHSFRVTAAGLVPGRYALTLAANPSPTRLTVCVARLASSSHTATSVTFTARIPARLHCYENDSIALGSTATKPGSYHLIVAVPQGPSGFALGDSFVRAPIKLTR